MDFKVKIVKRIEIIRFKIYAKLSFIDEKRETNFQLFNILFNSHVRKSM